MTAYTEGKHLVHAKAALPGLESKVTSTVLKDGTTVYYHVIRDETTTAFAVHGMDYDVRTDASGPYRVYVSSRESMLREFMHRHHAAVDTWTDLYMTTGVGTIEAAREHYEQNRRTTPHVR